MDTSRNDLIEVGWQIRPFCLQIQVWILVERTESLGFLRSSEVTLGQWLLRKGGGGPRGIYLSSSKLPIYVTKNGVIYNTYIYWDSDRFKQFFQSITKILIWYCFIYNARYKLCLDCYLQFWQYIFLPLNLRNSKTNFYFIFVGQLHATVFNGITKYYYNLHTGIYRYEAYWCVTLP